MDWLTGTTAGKMLYAFLISMVPVIELRVGLPLAIAKGLPLYLALPACILGNMVPVPFIIIFMLPVPLASLPAREICSEISVAGMRLSAMETL